MLCHLRRASERAQPAVAVEWVGRQHSWIEMCCASAAVRVLLHSVRLSVRPFVSVCLCVCLVPDLAFFVVVAIMLVLARRHSRPPKRLLVVACESASCMVCYNVLTAASDTASVTPSVRWRPPCRDRSQADWVVYYTGWAKKWPFLVFEFPLLTDALYLLFLFTQNFD